MGRAQLDHVHLGSLTEASNDQLLRAGRLLPYLSQPECVIVLLEDPADGELLWRSRIPFAAQTRG
jgi:hypothetical protein